MKIAYCHNNQDTEPIRTHIKEKTNITQLKTKLNNSKKPVQVEVENHQLVLNNEREDIKQRTLKAAKNEDELIIRIERTTINDIETLLKHDTTLTLPRKAVQLHALNETTKDILNALTPHTKGDVLRRHTGGRAPAGCRVEDGYLLKNNNYDSVRETLAAFIDGELSKEAAAERVDTTPRTIERASQRNGLYNLE